METYFKNILNEKKYDIPVTKSKINVCDSEMYQKLSDTKIPDDCYMLVHTETGNERKFIHFWCNQNNYQSLSIMCDFFEENHIWKCKLCRKKFYTDELYHETDYSFISGKPCGSILKCPDCEDSASYDPEDPEYSGLIKTQCFNCVLVARELPTVSRFCSRKKSKKNFDDNICNISIKEIIMIGHNEFMDRMKSYSQKARQQQKLFLKTSKHYIGF